ncbi:MAG: FMN-binding protein [Spirochaetaceae bacterium]|jgi:electron transport complex protein RnfG|nr:FMN-binding protein [Spirochaetaceae bacterium]
MKDSIKMIAALVVFALAACVGLAFVYDATLPVITENNKKKTQYAQELLFPGAQFKEISGQIKSGNPAVAFKDQYAAQKDGVLTGVIINSSSGGFNADIEALVGIDADGKIAGVQILVNTETPGLGANASNPKYFIDKPAKTKTFYSQFNGMDSNGKIAVEKDGGNVVAITAATISSRAVALLVAEAARAGGEWISKNGGAQ